MCSWGKGWIMSLSWAEGTLGYCTMSKGQWFMLIIQSCTEEKKKFGFCSLNIKFWCISFVLAIAESWESIDFIVVSVHRTIIILFYNGAWQVTFCGHHTQLLSLKLGFKRKTFNV